MTGGTSYDYYNRRWTRGAVAVGHRAEVQNHRRRRRQTGPLSK
nr:MAG TPA_asm: hypothetical protein [Caudoviricetes sp.]